MERVRELTVGESNLNFLLVSDQMKFVLRINADPLNDSKSEREHNILKVIENYHLAPRAVAFSGPDNPLQRSFQIIEYLEGKPIPPGERITRLRVRQLANLLARIHSLDKDALRKRLGDRSVYFVYDANHYASTIGKNIDYVREHRRESFGRDEFEHILDNSYFKIVRCAEKLAAKEVLLPGHGDVFCLNVLTNGRRLKLIDWENFGFRDPVSDIAKVFDAFGVELTCEQESDFLEEYTSVRVDPALRERLETFRPIVRLNEFVWLLREVFEIGRCDRDVEFVKIKDITRYIGFSYYWFERCKRSGILECGESEAFQIFPEQYGDESRVSLRTGSGQC